MPVIKYTNDKHLNEMYWETYLSDQATTQTVISLKTYRANISFGIDIR